MQTPDRPLHFLGGHPSLAGILGIVEITLGGATASTNATAQVYDVTVTDSALAGRYLVISGEDTDLETFSFRGDALIAINGITGALDASDFSFAGGLVAPQK
jgi:hypothetical protein